MNLSPRYDISINACSVDNVGDVDYYVDGVSYDSCGIRSPGIGYVDGAYRVGSDGDCVNSGSDGIMNDSYGIAFFTKKKITFALRTSTATIMCILWTRLKVDTLIFIILQMAFLKFPTGGALRVFM